MLRGYLGRTRLSIAVQMLAAVFLVAAILPLPFQLAMAEGPATVSLKDNTLDPREITITQGTTVTWVNRGKDRRRIESMNQHSASRAAMKDWHSDHLKPGESYSIRFDNPGAFHYISKQSGDEVMGIVTVTASAPVSPVPTTAPVTPGPAPATPAPTTPAPPPAPVPTNVAPPAAPKPAGASVSVIDNDFSPASLTVAPGTTVTWTHAGKRPHTVTSNKGLWDSGTLTAGQTFSFTLQNSGTYTYSCSFHGGMNGTIVVSGGGAPAVPSPTAQPGSPAPAPAPGTPPPAVSTPLVPAPAAPAPTTSTPAPAGPAPTTPAPAPVAGSSAVSLGDNFFSPASLTVTPGTTVTWRNTGKRPHSVTSDTGLWDSGTLTGGQSFSYTFQNAGTYSYGCVFHDGMVGTVIVGEAPIPTPAPTVTSPAPVQATPPPATPTPTRAPAPPAGGTAVSVGDNTFSPATLTVAIGATVTWRNSGKKVHTVTSDTGLWDPGQLSAGQSFSFTFGESGTYTYNCIFHDGMTGTVIVGDGGGSPTTAPSPAPSPSASPTVTPDPVVSPLPTPSATPPPAAGGRGVSIGDNSFSPSTMNVGVGATVVWTNGGHRPHTVTSDDGVWDSGILTSGQSFSFTFSNPGEYSYNCIFHTGMVGTISVSDAAAPVVSSPGGSPAAAISTGQSSATDAEGSQEVAAITATDGVSPAAIEAPANAGETEGTIAAERPSSSFNSQSSTEPARMAGGASTAGAVTMLDNSFAPQNLVAEPGASVTWTNGGRVPHMTTSSDGLWDSGLMRTGQTYTFTFDKAGTYRYTCPLHPGMEGVITIAETAAPATNTSVAARTSGDSPTTSANATQTAGTQQLPSGEPPEAQDPATQDIEASVSQPASDITPAPAISRPLLAVSDRAGQADSHQTGGAQTPVVVTVQAPGMSGFELLILAVALASIAVSSANMIMLLRPRRERSGSNSKFDW